MEMHNNFNCFSYVYFGLYDIVNSKVSYNYNQTVDVRFCINVAKE